MFIKLQNLGKWAVVIQLTGVKVDKKRGITTYQGEGCVQWVQISDILFLIGTIQDGDMNWRYIVTDYLIHEEAYIDQRRREGKRNLYLVLLVLTAL